MGFAPNLYHGSINNRIKLYDSEEVLTILNLYFKYLTGENIIIFLDGSMFMYNDIICIIL